MPPHHALQRPQAGGNYLPLSHSHRIKDAGFPTNGSILRLFSMLRGRGYAGAARPRPAARDFIPCIPIGRNFLNVLSLLVPAVAWRLRNIVCFWPYEKRGHPWVNASIPLGMIPAFRRMLRIRWRRAAARPEAALALCRLLTDFPCNLGRIAGEKYPRIP